MNQSQSLNQQQQQSFRVDSYIKNGIIKIKDISKNSYDDKNNSEELGLTNEIGELMFNTNLLKDVSIYIELRPIAQRSF